MTDFELQQEDLLHPDFDIPPTPPSTLKRRHPRRRRKAQPIPPPTSSHCNYCHFNFEGDNHDWCQNFPGLDSDTCPICNAWDCVSPSTKRPLLRLFDTPLEPYLAAVVTYYFAFPQLSYWGKSPFYLAVVIFARLFVRFILNI